VIIICQTLSRLMEMTYMILYEEESQGLEGPEKISTRWPARCHVTRHVHVVELKETAQVPPLTDIILAILLVVD